MDSNTVEAKAFLEASRTQAEHNMAGVYNRKLFRQSSARDELRKLGGIMSSSEELMREAMSTAMQAPRPADLGPMSMPQRPFMGMQAPMMPMQQPMMAPAPMPMVQPQMPMQQPMMPMQQPTMAQQAMGGMPFMPPQMPPSVQMPPKGFRDGALVTVDEPATRAGRGGVNQQASPTAIEDSFLGGLLRRLDEAVLGPQSAESVDISRTAGTVVQPSSGGVTAPNVDALVEKMQTIAEKIDVTPPEETAAELADAVVDEPTDDLRFDLAKTLEEMTGDSSAYEKNIDQLNRGIIGAAIAAGTSARATENIAKGLLVGMEGTKATEERRAGDAQALQLKALEVRAAEQAAREAEAKADQAAKAEAEARLAKEKRDLRTNTFNAVIEAGIDKLTVPEGMSIEEYARGIAEEQVLLTFPDERALAEARAALAQGADRGEVEKRLRENGIDPGRL
jgi:hypothetical protein